jgi:hypothetical protein
VFFVRNSILWKWGGRFFLLYISLKYRGKKIPGSCSKRMIRDYFFMGIVKVAGKIHGKYCGGRPLITMTWAGLRGMFTFLP